MIIRHIPMRKARLSNFSGLVQYLCNTQNKLERVGKISISNCNSVTSDWMIQEVTAIQAKNQRAKGDKTYHLLISFAPGENPDPDVLRAIEERVTSSIGFKEHQRISVVHHDTDNLHMHVAINKIHPVTIKMTEPYRAYKIFAEVAGQLEEEFSLEKTNHQARKKRSENLADDMEQHSGIESLINWMKHHCQEKINAASSWSEIHNILSVHGMTASLRGNGIVFCDKNGFSIKASSVCRSFSKKNLERKLGEYMPPLFEKNVVSSNVYRYEPINKNILNSELYAQYQHERTHGKSALSKKLKQLKIAKARLIEQAKRKGKLKRSALKLMNLSRLNKKYLYQRISQTLMSDIENVRANYVKARDNLIDTHSPKTWADWLQKKAQEGREDALTALRYRNRKNSNQYSVSGNTSYADAFTKADKPDSITKEGTEIYRVEKDVLRNTGNEIIVPKGGSVASLKKAVEMAQQQYGDCICVNGSPLFKKIILQLVVQYQIKVTFSDEELESQRQKLTLEREKHHEQAGSHRHHDRRGTQGGHGVIEISTRNNGNKPNAFSARRSPPTENQNSLRRMSQLDVVQLTTGSEVLLPSHAVIPPFLTDIKSRGLSHQG